MNAKIRARLIVLSLFFAVPTFANDDEIRILIRHENGQTERSSVRNFMTDYLSLLPRVDGDTIEIMCRDGYVEQIHGEEYSASMNTVKELFELLREHFRAEPVGDSTGWMLEFTAKYDDSWYIIELSEYSSPVPSGRLRIRRPNKVSLSGELVVPTDSEGRAVSTVSPEIIVKVERDTVTVIPTPLTENGKVFLPYSYGLTGVWSTRHQWCLDCKRNHRAQNEFQSISERIVVDARSGAFYREFTR